MTARTTQERRVPPAIRRTSSPSLKPGGVAMHVQRARIREILQPPRAHAKLTVGEPNATDEQQARRIAEQAMRMPVSRPIGGSSQQTIAGSAPLMIQRSPAWSSDALDITMTPLEPKTPGQNWYTENGFLSQRMSTNLPLYRGPFCQNVTLPFRLTVEFKVDYGNDKRPLPFTPPKVSVEFDFSPHSGKRMGFSRKDNSPSYAGQDKPLKTSFGTCFNFGLDDNGPFKMKFVLDDADTGIKRVYEDTIQIEAKRPCA